MNIPEHIKESAKVIGYFAYTKSIYAYCDGDACIIAGSDLLMKHYLQKVPNVMKEYTIKKTRFGEIIEGIKRGAAYAFDEESYERFITCAKNNAIEGLPTNDMLLEPPPNCDSDMHFVRVHMVG